MSPEPTYQASKPPLARLVVLKSVYHQTANASPTLLPPVNFSRNLLSDEQVYTREMPVGTEWAKVEVGWVENVGYLVIANPEGFSMPAQATAEEIELARSRRLLVGIEIDGAVVPITALNSNEGIDFDPLPDIVGKLRVKWTRVPGRVSIRAYPR